MPRITEVTITLHPANADEYRETDSYVVEAHWSDVDRPVVHGISTGGNLKLAERLRTAILAGAVYRNPEVRTDNGGKTYVSTTCMVLGRKLNADLKRLGF